MTREEAIEVLENGEWWEELAEWYMIVHPEHDKLHDAVDMAISALRQQEAVTKCRDLFDEDGGEILPNSSEMTLDDAIAHLDNTLSDTGRKWSCESCRMEHVQLREWLAELRYIKRKRNAPLTLDELREMDGEPVWCVSLGAKLSRGDGWYIGVNNWYMGGYGKKWMAYRQKPEEVQKCCQF